MASKFEAVTKALLFLGLEYNQIPMLKWSKDEVKEAHEWGSKVLAKKDKQKFPKPPAHVRKAALRVSHMNVVKKA